MAVTPNYSWPVPVATDYVKDGWEAISDLGNAIDTTVAGLGSGLTKITSTTFTNQAAATFDDVFTSTYDNYRIVTHISGITGSGYELHMRLRTSGTDNTTSNYDSAYFRVNSTGANGAAFCEGSANKWIIGRTDGPEYLGIALDIYGPQNATKTNMYNCINGANQGTATLAPMFGGNNFNSTTVFDGFKIYGVSGNITGKITIYGYQD